MFLFCIYSVTWVWFSVLFWELCWSVLCGFNSIIIIIFCCLQVLLYGEFEFQHQTERLQTTNRLFVDCLIHVQHRIMSCSRKSAVAVGLVEWIHATFRRCAVQSTMLTWFQVNEVNTWGRTVCGLFDRCYDYKTVCLFVCLFKKNFFYKL